jgi:hypothetical protein
MLAPLVIAPTFDLVGFLVGVGIPQLLTLLQGAEQQLTFLHGAKQQLTFLRGASLLQSGQLVLPEDEVNLCSILILPCPHEPSPLAMIILLFGENAVWYCEGPGGIAPNWRRTWRRAALGWTPGVPPANSLRHPVVSWLQPDAQHLELAGVDANGTVHWSQLDLRADHFRVVSTQASVRAEGYQAAALVRPGLVAGVSRSHIDWLRGGQTSFLVTSTMRVTLPHAAACFPCALTKELIVVCQDGVVARVPVPN